MKTTESRIARGATILLATLLVCACTKKDITKEDSPAPQGAFATEVNSYVRSLPSVKQQSPFDERKVGEAKSVALYESLFADGSPSAKDYYEQAKSFEEQLLFSDDRSVFYPGALLSAQSVVDGEYNSIETQRAPITISTDLIGGSDPTIKVDNPSLSEVRKAINELLKRGFKAPAANLSYSIEEVFSKTHLKVAMGGNYKGAVNSVEASAGFSFDKETNRFLVKVQQVFYELSINLPHSPADFFAKEFDYKSAFGKEKPLFVSSVKYGRVLLLGIETKMTKKEAESKLQASVLSGKVGANAEAAYNDLLKESSIKGRILGGDAKLGALAAVSLEEIKKFIEEGARLSEDNPGAPIAYKLKELGTNKTFSTVIYSKYTKQDPYAGEFSQVSFDLLIPDALKTVSGTPLRTGRGFIKFVSKTTDQETEFSFDRYWGHCRYPIPTYKSGDKIMVIFDRTGMSPDGYNKRYTFEIPIFETLVREGRKIEPQEGKRKLHDLKDSPLKIRDNGGELILGFGIENLKFEK